MSFPSSSATAYARNPSFASSGLDCKKAFKRSKLAFSRDQAIVDLEGIGGHVPVKPNLESN